MRHFRNLLDVTNEEVAHLVRLALRLKRERAQGLDQRWLVGRVLGLFFEKPSLRTRVSFEAGFGHLGGTALFLTGPEVGLGKRESVADFARVISRYIDILAVRTFSHSVIEELAANASCPVINALSDGYHPCQALSDLCTIQEHFGKLAGLQVTFVGDGNNVSRSLALAAKHVGIHFTLCCPAGYHFQDDFLQVWNRLPGTGTIRTLTSPLEAVAISDVIYTDVWTSMGQEAERAERLARFAGFQVNADLLALAKPTTVFLHCLPARRGEEVTAEVIDSSISLVLAQAENRMHAQKALILWLLQPQQFGIY